MQALTNDHKPGEESEERRIVAAGGKIYQTATAIPPSLKAGFGSDVLIGPYRVLPGRLSVSRTFGDPEAKLPQCGGNPNVVVATPDIISFKITSDHDFIVMGSDGIYDRLNNKDVVQCVWNTVAQEKTTKIHKQCGIAADSVLKNALLRRSLDNVTSVIIAFPSFKKACFPKQSTTKKQLPAPALSKKAFATYDRPPSAKPVARTSEPTTKPLTARNKSAQREAAKLAQTISNNIAMTSRRSDASAKTSVATTHPQSQPQLTSNFLSRVVPQSTRESKKRFDFARPKLVLADMRRIHA